jgi:methylmalonyl-CoA/ethylmalonyl-CoA epimerase
MSGDRRGASFAIRGLHQVAIPTNDLARAVAFYRDVLGAAFVAQFPEPGLAFFQLGEVRLLIDEADTLRPGGSVLYFRVDDISAAWRTLAGRGVKFDSEPHRIHRDENGTFGPAGSEEWMAFFRDPDGNVLALASRVAP